MVRYSLKVRRFEMYITSSIHNCQHLLIPESLSYDYRMYKSGIQAQMILESATFARGAQVSYPSLTSPLNSHHCTTFLQYLGKHAFIRRAIRFWKVPWLTIPNLLNKWPLNFACTCLNTQESSPSGTSFKRLLDG
ncbi:hypothetical protein Tsp_06757 [Trichinella spiralis]|uniref:hypothetical protein n=1 Tax=Trichinella spiralis TaxID=6334 RepID=UPI0001EFC3E8|nr:hypothetical protein Tsp_06757 [Trichinella spiralis]